MTATSVPSYLRFKNRSVLTWFFSKPCQDHGYLEAENSNHACNKSGRSYLGIHPCTCMHPQTSEGAHAGVQPG